MEDDIVLVDPNPSMTLIASPSPELSSLTTSPIGFNRKKPDTTSSPPLSPSKPQNSSSDQSACSSCSLSFRPAPENRSAITLDLPPPPTFHHPQQPLPPHLRDAFPVTHQPYKHQCSGARLTSEFIPPSPGNDEDFNNFSTIHKFGPAAFKKQNPVNFNSTAPPHPPPVSSSM